MPTEHHGGDRQHGGVEDLLAHSREGVGERTGKRREDAGAGGAAGDGAGYPLAPADQALRRRQDDADDQAGLEHLAKDDQQRREHGRPVYGLPTAVSVPTAVSSWYSSTNL